MPSAAQTPARHAKTRRSTGPRTMAGNASPVPVSLPGNATDGCRSGQFVTVAGEEAELADFVRELHAAIQPVGAVELDLFTQHVHASWTLRRCRAAEVAFQLESPCKGKDPLLATELEGQLALLDVYTRRAEGTYLRTFRQLQDLQLIRLSPSDSKVPTTSIQSPMPPPVLVDPIKVNSQRHASMAAAELDRQRETWDTTTDTFMPTTRH